MTGQRHAPATLRNRDAIVAVLRETLPASGLVLEVASGTGEHIVYFAAALPALDWQPSDPDPDARVSIAAWRAESGVQNVHAPILLDAAAARWPIARADALLCINMVHISPWAATVGLFTQGASLLAQGAPLILYGPYLRDGVETAPSNLAFDESLKARDADWGLRRLEDVTVLANDHGFGPPAIYDMRANNLMLVYRRSGG